MLKSIAALSEKRWFEILVIALLFAGFFIFQAPRLDVDPWDYDTWRQSDTYSIAVNYVQYDMNPLRPQFNYDGLSENYVQLELQIVPYISALIFKMTGNMTPAVPRAINILLFLGSALFLYALMKAFSGKLPAMVGLIFYLAMPICLLLSRATMPEACALFFYCGGVWLLYSWTQSGRDAQLWGASVMTAFAIMEKTPTIFVGLVFVYAFATKMGKSAFRSPQLYICGAITLLPPLLYTLYSSSVATFNFVDGIALKHILTGKIFSFFTRDSFWFFYEKLPELFTWPVLIMAAVGLLLCFNKKRGFILSWVIAFALECMTVVAIIKFGYYLIFIAPIFALLCSVAAKEIWVWRKQVAAVAFAFSLMVTGYKGVRAWQESTHVHVVIDEVGRFLAENTEPDEGIAIAVLDPAYLNAANRRGYRANIQYYDYIPVGAEEEIEYFIDKGVEWFVVVEDYVYNDADGSYLEYVKENFPVAAASEYCVVYDLTP